MKPEEVKIGNYFLLYKFGTYVKINSICASEEDNFCVVPIKNNSICYWINNPIPIRLNEKWFKKFKFKKIDNDFCDYVFDRYKIIFEIGFNSKPICTVWTHTEHTGNDWLIATIEYVHQFQNLYFSLTGEELTIK